MSHLTYTLSKDLSNQVLGFISRTRRRWKKRTLLEHRSTHRGGGPIVSQWATSDTEKDFLSLAINSIQQELPPGAHLALPPEAEPRFGIHVAVASQLSMLGNGSTSSLRHDALKFFTSASTPTPGKEMPRFDFPPPDELPLVLEGRCGIPLPPLALTAR